MTPNANYAINHLIIITLQSKIFIGLNKASKDFIISFLWHFLGIKGRIYFSQLDRFSPYCEQTHKIQFEKEFDFLSSNKLLIQGIVSKDCTIAFDPSYIPNSGKLTYGSGRFWLGSAKAAKLGLEIRGFAVVDVEYSTAFHLKAWQTPGFDKPDAGQFNQLSHNASLVTEKAKALKEISKYLVVDA